MSAAAASPALNPRAISKRLTEIRKNAINSRIVHGDFRIPCSNSQPGKNKKGVKAKKGTEVATEPGDEVESDSKVWRIIPPWLLVTADSLFLPYQKAVIPASDTSYLTPPATIKTESRTGWLIPTSKRSQGRKRTRCEQNTQKYHGNGNGEGKGNRYDSYQESDFNSDSDSDSLADLQDTPSKSVVANKKQRTLPARSTRGTRQSYKTEDETDVDMGVDDLDSADEFDPFKVRQDEEKREARKLRGRRHSIEDDD